MSTPRKRIISAAAQIFGRKGYRAATVREICHAARVNLASVNYYFGNKEALYRTVVTKLLERAIERYPADLGMGSGLGPEARLALFIRAILFRLLKLEGLSGFHGQGRLLARELADPSPVLDDLVQDHIGPQAAIMGGIIAEIIGPRVSKEAIMHCTFSIMGQCFYYGYAWPITTRLHPMDLADESVIEKLADHIAAFSLNGLKGLGASKISKGEPDA